MLDHCATGPHPEASHEASTFKAAACSRVRSISFDGCRGAFHSAPGTTGVVMCGPWGYEELVARHGWQVLAEALAAAGFPCLRFDYPGTADSVGELTDFAFADWIDATRSACRLLREAGARRLLLLGQSIGCLVACEAAQGEPDIAGLVLLAPVSGRRYLRELAAWSSMLAQVEGRAAESEESGQAIAGFLLPQAFIAEIKARAIDARAADYALLVEAPGRADSAATTKLTRLGGEVDRLLFEGLDDFIGDPTRSRVPQETYANIVDILVRRFGEADGSVTTASASALQTGNELWTDEFREEAISFGPDDSLFGIMCEPLARKARAAVLLLNTGRNAHIGWSRMSVAHARRLAAGGVASFRFDMAGVGDSPARPDRPAQQLYTEAPLPDVAAAVDVLHARAYDAVTLVGVCSGAYLGLLAALADPRVKSLVAINLPRFAWGKSESIEAAIRFVNRPNSQSLQRVFNMQTLRLVLTGRLDPRAAIKFRLKSSSRRICLKLARFIGPLSPGWPLRREVIRRLAALRARGVKIFLGYSAGDEGRGELELHFGEHGKRLAADPNVRLAFIENTDHNLTQPHARQWLLASIFASLGEEDRQSLPKDRTSKV